MNLKRRIFLEKMGKTTAAYGLMAGFPSIMAACGTASQENNQEEQTTTEAENAASTASIPSLFFKISLAEWSLNRSLFGGKLTNLDFPLKAKNDYGITGVEYVNQFFKDKAKDQVYLQELKNITDSNGIENVLIMIDGEGALGSTDEAERMKAVENHYKWVEAAKFLGCHSIRVNAAGQGSEDEVKMAAIEGLRSLSEFANDHEIGVIVENHGGYSSKGYWLAEVIKGTGMENCGTLPDFGNFCVARGQDEEGNRICTEMYDRYKGMEEIMPFAKGVSAKSNEFNAEGEEVHTDFSRVLQIVKNQGYTGYIGIEFEGQISEDEGIMATKRLLESAGAKIS